MEKNTIIIICGIQRAGTAMLMQMLEKGGCPIAIDDYRLPNEYNQNGYYENKSLLNINPKKREIYSVNLIKTFTGKAVKLYAGLVSLLPKSVFTYKVILIERNLNALWSSRYKCNPNKENSASNNFFAVQQKEKLKRINEQVRQWAKGESRISLLQLKYEDVIHQPTESAFKIEQFLQLNLDVEAMASAVDVNLYFEKEDKKYLKTDRSPLAVAQLINKYAKDKTYCEIGIGEGHNLNLVTGTKRKFGIERTPYGVKRCKELYPHLEIVQGDFFKVYNQNQFEICFLWIIYPYCKQFVSTILQANEQAIVMIGLNYWFHLPADDEKTNLYVNAYPKGANASKWNEEIKTHLIELEQQGFSNKIEQVIDDNEEIFSVAIIQKKN